MEFLLRKKTGVLEEWKPEKIEKAVQKSAQRTKSLLSDDEVSEVIALVENECLTRADNVISIEDVHSSVERALGEVRPDVAKSYIDYRNVRKSWAKMMEEITEKTNSLLFMGDRDNANADSSLASTIGCLMTGYLGTSMYQDTWLLPKELQAMKDGFIYVHDKDKRYYYSLNCCLFDVWTMLKNGFEMANIWYNEPKTLDTAFDVIGDIVLSAASQQYGGFTVYRVDEHLSEYAEKSYQRYLKKYLDLGIDPNKAEEVATADVVNEIRQGYQGWEYKFNTVASSRGDYPFITITLGLAKDKWGKLISKNILDIHKGGQGREGHKRPTLFPKIVFLYDERLHQGELADVYDDAISCSSVAAYPDYLSLTGEGYVPSMYKEYGAVISPMGCRAFLSPWYERGGMKPADENDIPIFEGRCNIGAVSLNLPLIYEHSIREGRDFFEVLDYYLEMIRGLHKRTYEWIAEIPAKRAPLHWCQGGLLGGNCQPNEKIGEDRLRPMTASFGITALNELQEEFNGKSLVEDGDFALSVLKYIENKVNEFKEEDKWLYAVYGTPAEKLCGLQVQQYRKMYGIKKDVSDRDYVSNSFHCHVREEISPIQKQDLENRFWNHCNGGKIQYVRYLNYNREAIKSLVTRAMGLGFYEGVNLNLCFCDDCGHSDIDLGDTCPKCGSSNITKIDRMNGYLAYSRVKGDTRLNKAKNVEIADRKSM